jgi:hypothetical protein
MIRRSMSLCCGGRDWSEAYNGKLRNFSINILAFLGVYYTNFLTVTSRFFLLFPSYPHVYIMETYQEYIPGVLLFKIKFSSKINPPYSILTVRHALLYLLVTTSRLKGQCHDMVVEVRPWSSRLGLN